jgi:hypothetical protein
MLTPTQRGTAGEQLFAACVTLSSAGELELFKPLTDDDHTDVTAGKRGKVPALAIQIKTALSLTRQGFAVARMIFPDGKPRQDRAFVYAILYVTDASVEAAWIVRSADFNRLTYRGAGPHGKGIELQFMASPTRLHAVGCRSHPLVDLPDPLVDHTDPPLDRVDGFCKFHRFFFSQFPLPPLDYTHTKIRVRTRQKRTNIRIKTEAGRAQPPGSAGSSAQRDQSTYGLLGVDLSGHGDLQGWARSPRLRRRRRL